MRLHLLGRHDSLLFAGLMFALLVVFQTPIQRLLDVAREVERTYNVALMPALLILTVMFTFHQQGKRREMKAMAAAAAKEVALARAKAIDLERLMLFGQALARALSTDALREAVWRHLPGLADDRDAWVVLRSDTGWERLIDAGHARWPAGELEAVADIVSDAQHFEAFDRGEAVDHAGHACFGLLVAGQPAGVLGFPTRQGDDSVRQKLAAVAALLSIAIKNAQIFADVHDNSVKDALTGCFRRAHTLEILDVEITRSRRSSSQLSIVMFDVDRFKEINDRYGHPSGDAVLATVGQRIRQVLRRSDVRCRYGGDEFLIVLPETSTSGAMRVAEWLRGEMEQVVVSASGERIAISISAGVATVSSGAVKASALIEQADQALYRAKAAGRNCVRGPDTAALAMTVAERTFSQAQPLTH